MGVERVGFYAMVGQAATYYRTSAGVPIPGSGIGNKGFNRMGFVGQFYFGPHFDIQVVTQHGSDNAWFGQGYGNAADPSNGDRLLESDSFRTILRERFFPRQRGRPVGTARLSKLTTCTVRS